MNVINQPIIGLEIHVELKTNSKMFCGCKNDPFHAPKPNIYTCPVCLGLPGALPVPNRKAIEWTIMLGLALGCEIPLFSKFDRKHYFYPDLPKGYQISQYDQPLAINGWVDVDLPVISNLCLTKVRNPEGDLSPAKPDRDDKKEGKKIRIHRVHLEEDTGKLLHATLNGKKVSLIDFNRSGIPLVEIVTEPDIRSSEEAKACLKKLHQIIRYLDISDADMEKGSMRLEPNISVTSVISKEVRNPDTQSRVAGDFSAAPRNDKIPLPTYKVEVKNINSFNFVKKAIDYEVERHIQLLEAGETPVQETRGWEEKKGITLPQRRKEEAHDYRYFPEPDIPPLRWTHEFIAQIQKKLPELPDARFSRFTKNYSLKNEDAGRLIDDEKLADFFEACLAVVREQKNTELTPQLLANWILNKKVNYVNTKPADLIKTISTAKAIVQIDESELEKIVQKVISGNPKAIADYKSGKTTVLMFLVGMVMKELKGKGDVQKIIKILKK